MAIANHARRTLTLESVSTGLFLSSTKNADNQTVVTLSKTASEYRLHSYIPLGPSWVRLQDVASGQFIVFTNNNGPYTKMKNPFGMGNPVDFDVTFVSAVGGGGGGQQDNGNDGKSSNAAVIVSSCVVLRQGDVIVLRSAEHTYFRRVQSHHSVSNNGNHQATIEPPPSYGMLATSQSFIEPESKFVVSLLGNDKFILRADNGLYLKRYCCWNGEHVVAIRRVVVDDRATFRMIGYYERYVYLQADNGYYVTLLSRALGYNHGAAVVREELDQRLSKIEVQFF